MKKLLTLLAAMLIYTGMYSQCNHPDDYQALRALYLSTAGDDWTERDNWLTEQEFMDNETLPDGQDMASWQNVTCINGRVSRLLLDDNMLSGTLPAEIGLLTFLKDLRVQNNLLTGEIPTEIGQMDSLGTLVAFSNQLEGAIPESIGDLTELEVLNLRNNTLEGSIPTVIGNLENLRTLALNNNSLTGIIPAELGALSNLELLNLANNTLSGNVPSSLGDIATLTRLYLQRNILEGAIPLALSKLENLTHLYLNRNNFSGCIHPEVIDLYCGVENKNFTNNPLLPFEGDLTTVCDNGDAQIGAPCDDGNANTNGETIQSDCSCSVDPPTEVCDDAEEYAIMKELWDSNDGERWTLMDNWNTVESEPAMVPNMAGWYGVTCTDGQISALALPDNGLEGNIVESLVGLEGLTTLDLSGNNLDGCVSEELISLFCGLANLDFTNNPLLPYEGDFNAPFCTEGNLASVGAPCNDGDPDTTGEIIQADCGCRPVCIESFECVDRVFSIDVGNATVSAERFANFFHDCPHPPVVQVRRPDSSQGDDDGWASEITFTCDDVDNENFNMTPVEIRVGDGAGNWSAPCTSNSTIQSKKAPEIAELLSDVKISCNYLYDREDLSVFGTYVWNEADREDVIIQDGTEINFGQDGLISEFCPGTITVDNDFSGLNDCGIGDILRTFTITDAFGYSIQDLQKITISLTDVFDPDTDIMWPEMYEYYGCPGTTPDPSVSGSPEILDSRCSMLTLPTYHDQEFYHPGGGCNKVVREWTVIDWCIYDEDTQAGVYKHEQFIKLRDSIPPTFDQGSCADLNLGVTTSDCMRNVNISASATDNCTNLLEQNYTYEFDLNNDGTVDENGSGNSFEEDLPIGVHAITWKVHDNCGNLGNCTQLINIVDNKAPSMTCIEGLVITMSLMFDDNGDSLRMSRLQAASLVKEVSDDCGGADIRVAFSPDPNDIERIYDCSDVGLISVDIYAIDDYGNYDYCTTTVTLQDNLGYCPEVENRTVSIAGVVTTENNIPLVGTEVILSGTESYYERSTNDNGEYLFGDLPKHDDYAVMTNMGEANRQDVSVIDLVMIQRHILGKEPFSTPYQYLASDVDHSESVTPLDLLVIRSYILGLIETFPQGKEYMTIDNQAMHDGIWPMVEGIRYPNLNQNVNSAHLTVLRMGDVNGSLESDMLNQTRTHKTQTIEYEIQDQSIKLFAPDDMEGIQLTLNLEGRNIKELQSSLQSFDSSNYHITDDQLIILWAGESKMNDDKPMLTIILDDNVEHLDGQGYLVHGTEEVQIRLNNTNESYWIEQNTPNPFVEQTQVVVNLDEEGDVLIKLYDQSGKTLFEENIWMGKGSNIYNVSDQVMNYNGVILFQAISNERSENIKMIKIK